MSSCARIMAQAFVHNGILLTSLKKKQTYLNGVSQYYIKKHMSNVFINKFFPVSFKNYSQLGLVWCRKPPQRMSNADNQSGGSSSDGCKPPSQTSTPDLMDFPRIYLPSVILTIRNWFFSTFIIRPYYDPQFSLKSFEQGAKQALVSVSEDLAGGELNKLSGRVTAECIQELSKTFHKMPLKQKIALKVNLTDIFFSFPYQLGLIFTNEGQENAEKIFLEITMCYHLFQDMKGFLEDESNRAFIGHPSVEHKSRVHIANYRFIREITKGVNDDWTINIINHFKLEQQE